MLISFLFRFFIEMCVSCCDHQKFKYNLACSFKVVPERYTISSVPHVSPEVSNDGWFPPRPWPSFRTCRSAWRGVTARLSHFCTPNLTLTPADPEEKTLSSADGSQYEITAVVFLLRLDFYVSRRAMWLVYKKSTGMLTQTNVTTII